ncbi:uncharacterized protein LOC129768471 [Toxorhynchites rutilus septentrionalis]|uniref:uncharacterized protein LOC129768471 n=1 Tax=Toxorhynchites rutilus septentrionalis TaxID=329112 RepID=UPI00247A9CB0|nr:uncharacterized protein LOC129768471 [Toxorhynchites rutilus septentrionalis]
MKCFVRSCHSDFNRKSTNEASGWVSKHRFPKKTDQRNRWLQAIANAENICINIDSINFKTVRVCSKHFTRNSYYSRGTQLYLTDAAVPTVFGFCQKPDSEFLISDPLNGACVYSSKDSYSSCLSHQSHTHRNVSLLDPEVGRKSDASATAFGNNHSSENIKTLDVSNTSDSFNLNDELQVSGHSKSNSSGLSRENLLLRSQDPDLQTPSIPAVFGLNSQAYEVGDINLENSYLSGASTQATSKFDESDLPGSTRRGYKLGNSNQHASSKMTSTTIISEKQNRKKRIRYAGDIIGQDLTEKEKAIALPKVQAQLQRSEKNYKAANVQGQKT